MKRFIRLFICFGVLLMSGCRKDSPISACNCLANAYACTDTETPAYNPGGPITQPNFLFDTDYAQWPYFNPNNPNEIIYYKNGLSLSGEQLIKYNLSTKQSQVLFAGEILYPPKWGRNGWILLDIWGQVYKIKENGDSLTQLTFGNDYAPEWNYTGDRFITEHLNAADLYNSAIFDVNGNLLDTLAYPVGGTSCWQNQAGLIAQPLDATSSEKGLAIINAQTNSLDVVFKTDENHDIVGPFWFPDGENILYTYSTCGIYKINYTTKATTCIHSQCSNDLYTSPCISAISQKIIYELDHTKYIGNNTYYTTSKLVLMNFDGSGQQVVPLN